MKIMTEDDFNDFMDSDDDAFLLEASMQDCDGESESLLSNLKNEENCASKFSESHVSTLVANSTTSQTSKPENLNNNHTISVVSNAISELIENDIEAYTPTEVTSISVVEDVANNLTKPDAAACSSSSLNTSISNSVGVYADNRFTPGFTPKAKKRKFPGPAGLLECFEESDGSTSKYIASKKMVPAMDLDFDHSQSSQFSLEHLSLLSWQKLQTGVSSNATLHSVAKLYSIQRVLSETSKIKLPKFLAVPILCVLLKEMKSKESSTMSVFMDDTDEIKGKIDEDVLTNYKEYMVEGTAFILQKVTFLLNVLVLKSENIVSIYLRDGRVKQLQSFESVLDTAESSKSTNNENSKPVPTKYNQFCATANNKAADSHHKSSSSSYSPTVTSSHFNNSKNVVTQNDVMGRKSSTFVSNKNCSSSYSPTITNRNFSNSKTVINHNMPNTNSSKFMTSNKSGSSSYSSTIPNKNCSNSKTVLNHNVTCTDPFKFMSSNKSGSSSYSPAATNTNCNNSKIVLNSNMSNSIPSKFMTDETASNSHSTINKNFNNQRSELEQNTTSTMSATVGKSSTPVNIKRGEEFLEDLLLEDNCLDDFDELLGNMDEKSFMGDF